MNTNIAILSNTGPSPACRDFMLWCAEKFPFTLGQLVATASIKPPPEAVSAIGF